MFVIPEFIIYDNVFFFNSVGLLNNKMNNYSTISLLVYQELNHMRNSHGTGLSLFLDFEGKEMGV